MDVVQQFLVIHHNVQLVIHIRSVIVVTTVVIITAYVLIVDIVVLVDAHVILVVTREEIILHQRLHQSRHQSQHQPRHQIRQKHLHLQKLQPQLLLRLLSVQHVEEAEKYLHMFMVHKEHVQSVVVNQQDMIVLYVVVHTIIVHVVQWSLMNLQAEDVLAR